MFKKKDNKKAIEKCGCVNTLIDSLSADLTPVKKCTKPLFYFYSWLFVIAVFSIIVVYFYGLRSDITVAFKNPVFSYEIILASVIAVLSALSSSYLMIPDMSGKKWLLTSTFTCIGLFVLWGLLKGVSEGFALPTLKMDHCMQEGLYIGIVPLTVFIFLMRCGATTHPLMMGVMNVLSVAGVGYLALRLTCAMDTVGHVTIEHLFPYLIIGSVIGILGRKIFKW